MRARRVAIVLACALFVLAGCAMAGVDDRSGMIVAKFSKSNDVHVAGRNVVLTTPSKGDILAAGNDVTLSGGAKDSVVAAGSNLVVSGPVGNDLYAVGENVTVAGSVKDNAYMAGSDVTLESGATIGSNLFAASNKLAIVGRVAGDVTAATNELYIVGVIDGDVRVNGTKVVIRPEGIIKGNLRFEGPQPPVIEPGGKVLGKTTHIQQTDTGWSTKPADWFFFGLLATLAYLAFGLLMVWAMPDRAKSASEAILTRTGAAIGTGIVVMIALPAAIVIACFTFVGIPTALVALSLYSIFLYAAWGFAAIAVGKLILERIKPGSGSPGYSLVVGVIVLALIMLIPVLGFMVNFVAVMVGLGAFLLSWWTSRQALRAPGTLSTGEADQPIP